MDMGMDMDAAACQISMLWNWYTLDTCFLSSSWHNHTKAAFAGSVIGVFFLVIAIEGVRRLGREYDRRLVADARVRFVGDALGDGKGKLRGGCCDDDAEAMVSFPTAPFVFRPSNGQQFLRSLVYGSQFTASFLVMLLGMYYNGYILFAIFVGQTLGWFIFGKDTCAGPEGSGSESGSCC